MAGDDFEVELHKDLQQYIDFTTNCGFLLFGFLLRRLGFIKDVHLPGMQVLIFTLCLPMLMVGVLWTAHIDQQVLKVLGASALTNTLWTLGAVLMARRSDPTRRGFYLMTSTASAMAYVYPVILRSDRLGVKAVPIVVMWELGGNIVVAVLFHGLVAQSYAPSKGEDGKVLLAGNASSTLPKPELCLRMDGMVPNTDEEVPSSLPAGPSPLLLGSASSSDYRTGGTRSRVASCPSPLGLEEGDTERIEAELDSSSPTGLMTRSSDATSSSCSPQPSPTTTMPYAPNSTERSSTMGTLASAVGEGAVLTWATMRRLGRVFMRVPLVWGILTGLALNMFGVPFTALPGRAVRSLTGAFAPLLYVMLGASLRFNLALSLYRTVVKALLGRWCANSVVILFVRYVLPMVFPLDSFFIGIITLCCAAPITTTFVMYSSQYGYKMEEVAMTKNISDVVSLVVLSALALVV